MSLMEESLLTKSARDLSKQEAFDLMIHHVEQGDIELVDPVKVDQQGNVIGLRPGQQVKVRTAMAGVDYYRVPLNNPGVSGSAGATRLPDSFRPTPAFAIVLYRFAKMLAEKWDVTKIVWGGIGAGRRPTDCHTQGRCIDFFGATIVDGVDFDVRRDWWSRTVFRRDGTPHAIQGGDRWGNDRNTYFRLALSQDPEDLLPRRFFGDVYQFVTEECTLALDTEADLFRIGSPLQAGTVIHPDYPVPGIPGVVAGRRGHNDHMHFQLGNAFG